jgi:hypothetical protein
MPTAVELRPDYSYEYDAELFQGKELSFGRIIRHLGIPRAIGKRAALRTIAFKLTADLNGVLNESGRTRHWHRWKYDEGDRERVLTPPFQETTEADGRISLTRLHVALPGGMTPQPIVHVEKILPSSQEGETMEIYAGPEIVWNLGRPESEMPMIGIVAKDGSGVNVSPEHNSQFFLNTLYAIRDAHDAFLPRH